MPPHLPDPDDTEITLVLPVVTPTPWGAPPPAPPVSPAPPAPPVPPASAGTQLVSLPPPVVLVGQEALFVHQLAHQYGLPPDQMAQQLAHAGVVTFQPSPSQWAAYQQYAALTRQDPQLVAHTAIAAAREHHERQHATVAANPVRRALFASPTPRGGGCLRIGVVVAVIAALVVVCCGSLWVVVVASALLGAVK